MLKSHFQERIVKKEDIKPFSPCKDGYIWFLENFPVGGNLKEVYENCPQQDWKDWLSKYFSFNPRFKDLGDNIVRDTETGLEWIKDHTALQGFADSMTYAEAEEACKKLNVGGHSDWRLPTREELQTILDLNRYDPAIDPIFTNTKCNYYRTSTPCAWYAGFAWVVGFSSGGVYGGNKDVSCYFRPVRPSK